MIQVEHLTKRYGAKVAVNDLSFALEPGKITGFLGPNGSGKSTTMRCIMGLDAPTEGNVLIAGKRPQELRSPLTTIGALLDGKAFHPARTARSQLSAIARTHGIPKQRVDDVLEMTGLTQVASRRLKGYSLGMGQRLGIAIALLGDPQILLFDEPVNGLDPEGVRWVRQLLRSLANQGRTILVSSHLMSEMALTADNLIVIGRGKLIAQGPITDFTQRTQDATIRVVTPTPEALAQALHTSNTLFEQDGNAFNIEHATLEEIGHIAYQAGVELHELSASYATLEDVFMDLTHNEVEYGTSMATPGIATPSSSHSTQPVMIPSETSALDAKGSGKHAAKGDAQ